MKKSILILSIFFLATISKSQNVGIGTPTPLPSAQLDITSTTKGFLPPRMTATQRSSIASPAEGLLVFQSDSSKGYYYFIGGTWIRLNDEKTYPSVTICSQKWMEKNLDVSTYQNGDTIPFVTNSTVWASMTTGAWCYYNNDPSTNGTYGKLYNWYAVTDPRGIAPQGWHIPTDLEWTTLETCIGGTTSGGQLKVSGTTTWISPNTGATNSSGFAGLPGGYRDNNGTFVSVGYYSYWWSSTASGSSAWDRALVNNQTTFYRTTNLKQFGFSVRCLRD